MEIILIIRIINGNYSKEICYIFTLATRIQLGFNKCCYFFLNSIAVMSTSSVLFLSSLD